MQIVVNGYIISYVQKGTGPIILLIHGWADSSRSWSSIIKHLSEKYKVIAPDLPGFGGSQSPNETWGLDEYAHFIRDFLEKINSQKLHAIIGHSNGGSIAIKGLSNEYFLSDKLVLLASAGIRGTNKIRNTVIKALTKTGKAVSSPLPSGVKSKLRHRLYDAVGSDMLIAPHLEDTFKKVVSEDVRDDAKNVTIPTLMIYGEQDDQSPIWYGEQFHELIDGSTLEIISDAGHFVHIEKEKEVLKSVEGFLQ